MSWSQHEQAGLSMSKLVIQPILHNCASWIGITEKHINELQKFQNKFIRRVLHLAHSVTHAILDWDVGMLPMEWWIKEKQAGAELCQAQVKLSV